MASNSTDFALHHIYETLVRIALALERIENALDRKE
jgi:hypothetical protein